MTIASSICIGIPCALLMISAGAILWNWAFPAHRRITRALERQREEQRLRERRAWRTGRVVRV